MKEKHILKKFSNSNIELKIVDSVMLNEIIEGFDEYIPISLSPSKKKLMIAKKRGGKVLFICDLKSKSYKKVDFSGVKNDEKYPEGIYNSCCINDSIIIVTYRNELYKINVNKNKLISKTVLKEGYYSSYSKKIIPFITKNDTILVSQFYSPQKSKFNSESDGFYDLSPLSIYSMRKKEFLSIYLPKNSIFKNFNLGQPIVNFTNLGNTVYFHVSPENKIYSFVLDTANFKASNLTSYQYSLLSDTIIREKRSNFMKDLARITSMNPVTEEIVFYKNFLLLNYSKALKNDEYRQLFNSALSEKERIAFFIDKRKTYYKKIDLTKKLIYESVEIDKNIESIAMNISDTLFVLKPKIAFYKGVKKIPIYIAKLN